MDKLTREIWVMDDVFASGDSDITTLIGDCWDETNDGRRIFWVPGGRPSDGTQSPRNLPVDAIAGQPLRMYDDTATSPELTHSKDRFRGGPGVRLEHYHDIPTKGYRRLWIEWSGECVVSGGFVPVGAGPANTRLMVTDTLFVAAHGVGFTDPALRYTQYPQAVCYGNGVQNGLFSTMGNSAPGGTRATELQRLSNNRALFVKAPGVSFQGLALFGSQMYRARKDNNVFDAGGVGSTLCEAVLWWGYVEFDGAGNARTSPPVNGVGSRMPQTGDRYGFIVEIGWPEGACGINGDGTTAPSHDSIGELSVEAFDRVFVALCSIANVGANISFVANSHFVKGRMYAHLTRPSIGPKPEHLFIDRNGKVTEIDPAIYQTQGGRRA